MDAKEFSKIKQWDVVRFQRDKDKELEVGCVLKKSETTLLLAGIDNGKGFWHPAGMNSVHEVVSKVNTGTRIKEDLGSCITTLEAIEKEL